MRISQAAIRGGRPVTRFTAPGEHHRQRHLGLRRGGTILAATSSAAAIGSPLIAVRRAARGVGQPLGRLAQATRAEADGKRVLLRSDSVQWSRRADGNPQRARPRSAAPWRV
jgi:hypothetical protein